MPLPVSASKSTAIRRMRAPSSRSGESSSGRVIVASRDRERPVDVASFAAREGGCALLADPGGGVAGTLTAWRQHVYGRRVGRVCFALACFVALVGVSALAHGAARADRLQSATVGVYFPSECNDEKYRPRRVVIACADGNLYATHLRWHHWNRRTAIGYGSGHLNDCNPDCARGRFHRYRIRIRLSRRRFCSYYGLPQYTRLAYRWIGRRRPHERGQHGLRFPCAGYKYARSR
jgi:hypothetical protein